MIRTNDNRLLAVESLQWDEAIARLYKVNALLASAMEKLTVKPDQYTFYLAKYTFGSPIIDNKKTFLPLQNGEVIDCDSQQLPDIIKDNLCYDSTSEDPLGIVLSKTSEFYLLGKNSIQPQGLITPGQMFGIPRAVDKSATTSSVLKTNLNAGARSVFMLPKISDQINHSKLQEEYGIKSPPPLSPRDHWQIFVELSKKVNPDWCCEVIFFPRNWIKNLQHHDWAVLVLCLMQIHRKSYSIWHNVADIWDITFQNIEQAKGLKNYSMQSLVTAKQLFKIATNIIPGFRPATNDDALPQSKLSEIYNNVYNKWARPRYNAIIMEPCKFNLAHGEPIYDSLNYATFSENLLEASRKKSHIALLDEIRVIIDLYIKGISERKHAVQFLYDIVKNINFSYYHPNPENYKHIKNALLLKDEDSRFMLHHGDEFPNNAPFFKGCIKIARN